MCTSIKLEWTVERGPKRGEKVTCWFLFGDPEIGRLCKKHKAKVIDRR